MIAPNVAELQERIAQLESILGAGDDAAQFMVPFGLSRSAAQIVGLLMRRKSATHHQIWLTLYGGLSEREQPTANVISVLMVRTRRMLALHDITVQTLWGVGYFMDEANKARLRAVLEGYQR